jgi:hypothetical protein
LSGATLGSDAYFKPKFDVIEPKPLQLKEAFNPATGKNEMVNYDPSTGATTPSGLVPPVPVVDASKKAELSNKLRDDLNKASLPFITMRNYYAKIKTSASDATGASDAR